MILHRIRIPCYDVVGAHRPRTIHIIMHIIARSLHALLQAYHVCDNLHGNGENQQPCQWYKLFIYIDSATIIVGGVDESVCYRCAHLPQPRVAELWK